MTRATLAYRASSHRVEFANRFADRATECAIAIAVFCLTIGVAAVLA